MAAAAASGDPNDGRVNLGERCRLHGKKNCMAMVVVAMAMTAWMAVDVDDDHGHGNDDDIKRLRRC